MTARAKKKPTPATTQQSPVVKPTIVVGPRECAQCGYKPHTDQLKGGVLVTMLPGHDHTVWFLCTTCFIDGCKPVRVGNFKIDVVSDELADALRAGDKAHMEVPERQQKAGY